MSLNPYIRLNCEYGYIQCYCILMSTAKAALKSAKEAFITGNHRETVQLCKKALNVDKNSYDAYLCGPPNTAVVAAAAFLNALALVQLLPEVWPLMWCRLLGKASFLLHEHEQAALAYAHATDLSESALPAWKGLAELHKATGDSAKAASVYERLVRS